MRKVVEILKNLWEGKTAQTESLVKSATIDLPLFQQRLAQTIAWSSSRVDVGEPATCLRSSDLRPPSRWIASELNVSWEAIVAAIVESRGHWPGYPNKLPKGLANSRLLLATSITDGTEDGATEVETQGFFDLEDLPPWDTWLCYLPGDSSNARYRHGYLVSWVPPEFIDVVEAGMEVECLGCLRWAEDEDTAFTRQLRAAGLLR